MEDRGEKIPEIRFNITEKLDKLISKSSDDLGVSKSEYVKSLVLRDLRAFMAVPPEDYKSNKGREK